MSYAIRKFMINDVKSNCNMFFANFVKKYVLCAQTLAKSVFHAIIELREKEV